MRIFGDEEAPKYQLRRHMLTLLLTRKLLGCIKSRAFQQFNDLPTMTPEEEDELVTMVGTDSEEEEENLGTEGPLNEVGAIFRRGRADVSIEGGCQGGNGSHGRIVVKKEVVDGESWLLHLCKDCRTEVRRVRTVIGEEFNYERNIDPAICNHTTALWKPAFEGLEAMCKQCGSHIPDPSIFKWQEAGLEVYGDDPSKDTAVIL